MGEGFFGTDHGRPNVGTQPDSRISFDDVLAADGGSLHFAQTHGERGLHRAKPSPINFERYYDPKYVDLEVEHLWSKHWTCAGREEDIPNVGDRMTYDIVESSFIIMRNGPDSFKAFYNSCPHRARALCDGKGSGKHIQCEFHAWTWDLDGKMIWLPSAHDFPHVKMEDYRLQEVKVGRWGGNLFINPDPDAAPFEDFLGVLKTHFADCPGENRYTAAFVRKRFRANWKIVQEAFLEAYHMVETHWDALTFTGDTATRYDCWEEGHVHMDRLTTPTGMPSAQVDSKVSVREALEQALAANQIPGDVPAGRGETISDARAYLASLKREQLRPVYGDKVDQMTNSYLLDAVRYFLYPNFHPWWGEGVPIWYRFLPDGRNADQGIMEIRVLLPLAPGQARPAAAAPQELGIEDRCADVPALGFLGHVIDQDIQNITRIQDGLKAAHKPKAFMTLAREQESSIAHFHEFYDKALKLR